MRAILSVFVLFQVVSCADARPIHAESYADRHADSVANERCRETRAAFDVGSATTRLMVATVNTCEYKILSVLKKEERAVPYKDDLERSSSKEFSIDVQSRGLAVFSELSSIAKSAGATRFAGTATSAFRGAKNSEAYVARVKAETGVSLFVIEQKIEAEMGFLAATSEPDVDLNNVVVWDIGGGSMQFSARVQNRLTTSVVELGSVGFKNEVLRVLRPEAKLDTSPNPIGASNFEKVVSLARQHALKHTDPAMRALLKQRQVIGIGGVHSHSVTQVSHSSTYNREQVEEALRERLNLTDAQVGGAYASTNVTNLALVLGYMQALEIPAVRAININLTNGTVLYPGFWL